MTTQHYPEMTVHLNLKTVAVKVMEKNQMKLEPIPTGNNSRQYRIIGGDKDGKTLRLRTSKVRVVMVNYPLGDVDKNADTDYWLVSMPCVDNPNQAEIFLIPSKEILKVIKDNHLEWLKENPHKNSRFGLLNFDEKTVGKLGGDCFKAPLSARSSDSAAGSERSRSGRMPALYSFIKYPPGVRDLPKQARQILEILEAKKQCTKEELLAAMEGKVVTVQTQERILGYYQTRLIDSGFMEVRRGVPGEVPETKVKKSMSIKEVIDRARSEAAAVLGVEKSRVRVSLTVQDGG